MDPRAPLLDAAPVAVTDGWLDADGLSIHTVTWTPGDTEPTTVPIVLVHGLGASTISWEPVASTFAQRWQTRVVALDLPGFGRTRCTDRPITLRAHRRALTALLRAEGPAVVMGNSMGGATGVGVAAQSPDLVHGLVLVNAAYPRPGANLDRLAITARFATLAFPRAAEPIVRRRAEWLGPEGLVDSTLGLVFADSNRIDPELRARLVDLATDRRGYPEAARAYTDSGGSLFRYVTAGMRSDLDAVKAPTLVVHGAHDRLVPVSFARAVARRHPRWRYVELADCGHAPQMEDPDRLLDVVTRWAGRELRKPAAHA